MTQIKKIAPEFLLVQRFRPHMRLPLKIYCSSTIILTNITVFLVQSQLE